MLFFGNQLKKNQTYMHWNMYTIDAQISSCMFRHSLGAIIRGIHCIKVMLSIFFDACNTALHTSENIEVTTLTLILLTWSIW